MQLVPEDGVDASDAAVDAVAACAEPVGCVSRVDEEPGGEDGVRAIVVGNDDVGDEIRWVIDWGGGWRVKCVGECVRWLYRDGVMRVGNVHSGVGLRCGDLNMNVPRSCIWRRCCDVNLWRDVRRMGLMCGRIDLDVVHGGGGCRCHHTYLGMTDSRCISRRYGDMRMVGSWIGLGCSVIMLVIGRSARGQD